MSGSSPASGASAAGTSASFGRVRSAALNSNPGMRRHAIMGTDVLYEHVFSCQAYTHVVEIPTPLEPAPTSLVDFAGRGDLWLKREDVHELGVFKWRGALPVVEDLAHHGNEAVVTASTGNHGAAVAWASRRIGIRAVVFVPPGSAERKLATLDRLGADLHVAGSDLDEAKDAARAY